MSKLDEFKDEFAKIAFGRSRTHSLENRICVSCGDPAINFRDELSRKEYQISGFCQRCQDAFFEDEEDFELDISDFFNPQHFIK